MNNPAIMPTLLMVFIFKHDEIRPEHSCNKIFLYKVLLRKRGGDV